MKLLRFIVILISCKALCAKVPSQILTIDTWLTNSGVKVVYYKTKHLPILDLRVAFPAGSAYDNHAFGISMLTSQMLDQGDPKIAQELETLGAQYSARSDRDMAVFHLRTLTAKQDSALKIFKRIINEPKFSNQALERIKSQMITAWQHTNNQPENIAEDIFFNILYKNHPYGHNPLGNPDSIQKISLPDIATFYKKQYIAGPNSVIVIVGFIDNSKAHEIAEQLTKDLPINKSLEKIPNMLNKFHQITSKKNHAHSPQSTVYIGQVGISHHNKNYFSLIVGNYILGGFGLNSQLAKTIREQQGLTYDISSQFIPLRADGPFYINFATKKGNLQIALSNINKILNNFIQNGPSEEEVVAAKRYLIGHFPISLDSNAALANIFLRIAFYDLPDDYLTTYTAQIEAVTKESIKKAFQELIKPKDLLTVIVG